MEYKREGRRNEKTGGLFKYTFFLPSLETGLDRGEHDPGPRHILPCSRFLHASLRARGDIA